MSKDGSFDLSARRRTKPVPAKVEDRDLVDSGRTAAAGSPADITRNESQQGSSARSEHHSAQQIKQDPIEYMDVSVSTRILMRYKLMIDEEVLARKKDPSRGPAKIRSVLEHALENTYGESRR